MKNFVETKYLFKVVYDITNGLTEYAKDGITKDKVVKVMSDPMYTAITPNLSFETMEEWLKAAYGNPKPYNDFECKLADIFFFFDNNELKLRQFIETKQIGLAIYGFVGAKRNQDKIAKIKEANKDVKDEYFGVPGQRTDMQLVVDKVIGYEDYFIILLHDDENRQFKWSTAKNPFTVGNKYSVKGTIVRHNEYNGIKQTVINRCKVLAA